MMASAETKRNTNWVYFIATILLCRLLAHYVLPICDDAYIIFRYARNFANGLGFVYNPGDWVQGVTCPGFGVLLAGFYYIGIDLPTFVPLMNIVIDLLVFYLGIKYLLNDSDRKSIVVFGFLFAVSPICNYICVSSMEVNAFLTISLLAIILFVKGRPVQSIALATCTAYLRPEGILLIILLFVRVIIARQFRQFSIAAVVSIAIGLPYFILTNYYYGSFLPQSILAKSIDVGTYSWFFVLRRLVFSDYIGIVLLPFSIIGAYYARRTNPTVAVFTEWAVFYTLVYLIAQPHIFLWYALPVQFALIILASIGVTLTGRRLLVWWEQLDKIPVYVFGLLAVLIWASVSVFYGQLPVKKYVFRPLKDFCSSTIPQNKTMAAYDIGLVGYYSNSVIYDLCGLVWKPGVKLNKIQSVVDSLAPDYLMVWVMKSEIAQMQPASLGKYYRPLKRFSVIGDTNLTPDYLKLTDIYARDYIIYQKKSSDDILN